MRPSTILSTKNFRLQSDHLSLAYLSAIAALLEDHRLSGAETTHWGQLNRGLNPILVISDERLSRPFAILSRRRAKVTTSSSLQISQYAGLNVSAYLALVCHVALIQLEALARNPQMEAEDMLYTCHPHCLFTRTASLQEYALVLDNRHVCCGCEDFYSALGIDKRLFSAMFSVLPNPEIGRL
jgi:hypothetical protein